MKNLLFKFLAAILFLSWMGCEPPPEDGYSLTFGVDMSDIELTETDTVGIRGSVSPLSWTETYMMQGPDENGVYSVTVPFKEVEYGTRVLYKYIINDSIWDNDKYAESGNLSATICCNKQILPVDVWNHLDEFTFESMHYSSAWDVFMSWIFTLSKAKERGLTMEESAQENLDFWAWPDNDIERPEIFLMQDRFYQAKAPFGYFEVIENNPNKVEYIKAKDWEILLYEWNAEGVVQGITAEEMNTFFKKMMEISVTKQGWKLDWQDVKDHKVKITITK